MGVERVDVERDADDDDAVVVGARQSRRDRRQAQRRALERPGEVHPADRVEGMFAGPGGDVGGADEARARAARRGLLGAARVVGGGEDRGFRAVADAAQRAGEAGRQLEVEVAEELVAVVAVQFEDEVGEVAGLGVRRAGHQAWVEGPRFSRAGAAVGARGELTIGSDCCGASSLFQGTSWALDGIDRAAGRGRDEAAVGGEEVQVELLEGHLRQVGHGDREAGRCAGSGRKEAKSLAWMPKPSKIMKARYWLPGFGSPM